jgi:hypothetical protein
MIVCLAHGLSVRFRIVNRLHFDDRRHACHLLFVFWAISKSYQTSAAASTGTPTSQAWTWGSHGLDMAQWGLGMDRFALSKLENVTNENPTIDTLLRYAEVVGKRLQIQVVDS